MAADNIKIAVRVRPFNQRELDLNPALIIDMNGPTTKIKNPETGEFRSFTFDYSYWSHDSFDVLPDGTTVPQPGSKYADQKKLFKDLGTIILENAWQGYNTTLLAYGQTGAGKSFSMVGYGANRGLVPLICEEIFEKIKNRPDPGKTYRVAFSMMEIYQEKIHDLLVKDSGNLKVRHNPSLGFYVEDLQALPVQSYAEIEGLSETGMQRRTVAATKMNSTSSRSHTIIMITFIQVDKADNTEKRAIINLVDLAGSERTDDAGTAGLRLQEGVNINSSLSVLGNVISAIVAKQQGNKKIVVPYRDSTLTKLLANALGGNSKTIMIAAISPSDVNYQDTLSTLRFMDRAKAIRTAAVVNENPTDKLIRELREENERLKSQLGGGGQASTMTDEERTRLQQKLQEQEMAIQEMDKSWQQRVDEARAALEENMREQKLLAEKQKEMPYLKNVNEDPMLTGKMIHFISLGEHLIGKRSDATEAPIQLGGLSILDKHAMITNEENKRVTISPIGDAKVCVNGQPLASGAIAKLNQNDRILLGTQNVFIVKIPGETDNLAREPTWRFVQAEIAKASGFNSDSMVGLYSDITELLPAIREANAIAEELDVPKAFEIMINMSKTEESKNDHTEKVYVKINDFEKHMKWRFTKSRFLAARIGMQEMYSAFIESGVTAIQNWPKEKNPFELSPEDWLIGKASVLLKPVAYSIDIHDTIMITDVKGATEGLLRVSVELVIPDVDVLSMSTFGSDPRGLIGERATINITIHSAMGLRWTKGSIYCAYQFFEGGPLKEGSGAKVHVTQKIAKSSDPLFEDVYCVEIPSITKEIVEYMQTAEFHINVWGVHEAESINKQYRSRRPSMSDPSAMNASTMQINGSSMNVMGSTLQVNVDRHGPSRATSADTTLDYLQKITEMLQKATNKDDLENLRGQVLQDMSKTFSPKGKEEGQDLAILKSVENLLIAQEKAKDELEQTKRQVAAQKDRIAELQAKLAGPPEDIENIKDQIRREIKQQFFNEDDESKENGGINSVALEAIPSMSYAAISPVQTDVPYEQYIRVFEDLIFDIKQSKTDEEVRNRFQKAQRSIMDISVTYGENSVIQNVLQSIKQTSGQIPADTEKATEFIVACATAHIDNLRSILNAGPANALKQLEILANLQELKADIGAQRKLLRNAVHNLGAMIRKLSRRDAHKGVREILTNVGEQIDRTNNAANEVRAKSAATGTFDSKISAIEIMKTELEQQQNLLDKLEDFMDALAKNQNTPAEQDESLQSANNELAESVVLLEKDMNETLVRAEDIIEQAKDFESKLLVDASQGLVRLQELRSFLEKLNASKKQAKASKVGRGGISRPASATAFRDGGSSTDAAMWERIEQEFKRREGELEKRNQKAVNYTMNALNNADDKMKSHLKRVDHLQSLINNNLARSKALEQTSKDTANEIKRLKNEITRLNNIITQRSEDQSNQYKHMTQQIIEKNKLLVAEMANGVALRKEIERMKAGAAAGTAAVSSKAVTEGVTVAAGPSQANTESITVPARPPQAKTEGATVVTVPIQTKEEDTTVATGPMQEKTEGSAVAPAVGKSQSALYRPPNAKVHPDTHVPGISTGEKAMEAPTVEKKPQKCLLM